MPAPGPQANRTDLLTPAVQPQPQGQPNGQPIQVPTGLPYGENQQLQQAQSAVPLPGMPQAPTPPPGASGQPPGGIAAALGAARQFQMPDMGNFQRGTERPGEAVTAGLPGGPAPAPGAQPTQNTASMASMLTRMAAATGSAALSQLAGRAAAVGQ